VDARCLDRLKEVVSLHQALGINKEGLDIILELRSNVAMLREALENLQRENRKLRLLLGAEDRGDLENKGLTIEVIAD
jgi:hypothetical protein